MDYAAIKKSSRMLSVKTQIAFSDKLNQGKYQAMLEQARRLGVIRTLVKRYHAACHLGQKA